MTSIQPNASMQQRIIAALGERSFPRMKDLAEALGVSQGAISIPMRTLRWRGIVQMDRLELIAGVAVEVGAAKACRPVEAASPVAASAEVARAQRLMRKPSYQIALRAIDAAARAGLPCPSNSQLAELIGVCTNNASAMVRALEVGGVIRVERGAVTRIVTIVETGVQTAEAKAPGSRALPVQLPPVVREAALATPERPAPLPGSLRAMAKRLAEERQKPVRSAKPAPARIVSMPVAAPPAKSTYLHSADGQPLARDVGYEKQIREASRELSKRCCRYWTSRGKVPPNGLAVRA